MVAFLNGLLGRAVPQLVAMAIRTAQEPVLTLSLKIMEQIAWGSGPGPRHAKSRIAVSFNENEKIFE